jgi:hypothetical protein
VCGVPPLQDRLIVHFTHVSNLPAMLAAGCIKSDELVRAEAIGINECGNVEIKQRRRGRRVPMAPEGLVSEYVPFYFAPRSPMLYSIYRGNVPTYSEGQEPLVYLWSRLSSVEMNGLTWTASDGNCASDLTLYSDSWATTETMVDWPLMGQTYWNNTTEDGDRMRRRMAEFLVYQRFPLAAVNGIVVKSEQMAVYVRSLTANRWNVEVKPGWYY